MLDTDQLRSFLAIVDTGSFTRAADRVNKTQSAISMHIRRLEERLGTELFVKQGRGVRLSASGERLIDTGRVRIGIPDDYAEPFLPAILSNFRARNPLVEIAVICEASVHLSERIRSRDLDLALVTDCAVIHDVEVIREEPLVWISRGSMRFEAGSTVPLALGGPTCSWRQQAEAALEAAGLAYRLVLVSNNYAAIAPIVDSGLAITILPLGAMRPGQRVLNESDGLPKLTQSRMGLIRPATTPTREALALAEEIRGVVGLRRAS